MVTLHICYNIPISPHSCMSVIKEINVWVEVCISFNLLSSSSDFMSVSGIYNISLMTRHNWNHLVNWLLSFTWSRAYFILLAQLGNKVTRWSGMEILCRRPKGRHGLALDDCMTRNLWSSGELSIILVFLHSLINVHLKVVLMRVNLKSETFGWHTL